MTEKTVQNNSIHTLMGKKFITMLMGGTMTMMVVSVLLMSDQIIAGITIGSEAVSGIVLVTPLYSLEAFFGSIISLGVPILYSTEMGKFNKDKADKAFGMGILMAIVIGVAMAVFLTLFGNAYLRSGTVDENILEQAEGYMFWIRFTLMILPMQMLIGAMVYYDGDETITSIANGIQGLGNIIFSVVLSHFMGIRGIGLASFLFNLISLAIFMLHFTKENNSLKLGFYFSFGLVKDVVQYSIIDSSSYLFISILTAALNSYVSTHFGSEYLILVAAVTMSREFQLLFDGIGEATGPIFSVYVGENNSEGIRRSYGLANKTAIIEGIIVTVVMIIIAPVMPGVMDVTDPELAHWIVLGVRMMAFGSTFVSLLYLLTSYYLVIEKIALGLMACALRDVIFSISLVFVLGGIWGKLGLFMGLVTAPMLAYGALMLYIRIRYGSEDCPLLLSKIFGGEQSYIFNLTTDKEEIIRVQKEVEALLKENNVDSATVYRVSLLIEEMYLFIRNMNDDKPVLAECTVFLKEDGVQIISKDGGVSFDMADEDVSTTSLSAYIVSSYLEKRDFGNRHLTSMGFNRSLFLIKYNQE